MAEQLRPYTTFVDNPSSVHRTHTEQPTTTWKPSSEGPDALSGASIFICAPHNCIQIYMIKKRSFLKRDEIHD